MNEYTGVLIGVTIYTPYYIWARGHRCHHTNVNNIDSKQYDGISAPWTTVDWNVANYSSRIWYLFNYGPITYFTIMPFLTVVFLQRFSCSYIENCSVLIWLTLIYLASGIVGVYIEFAIVFLFTTIGYLLFHVQHTFENSYKANNCDWNFIDSALLGSSFALIPNFLKYFTLGIEYHHIHHLNPQVPCYRLQKCHETADELDLLPMIERVNFSKFLSSLGFSIYNICSNTSGNKGFYSNVYMHAISSFVDGN